jgi:hypothetical protein
MTKNNPTIEAFKIWIFPTLVSILAMMIWNDVSEIKADVKALMAQSNIDKTRIDNLERQIYKTPVTSLPLVPFKSEEPKANEFAILSDNKVKLIKYAL